uniref:RING-type domain-containing protein n=1 Tax=Panagrolaimus sp. JU765 TaxID=591449 RepID=A0AC34QBT8_9BILA
MVSGLMSPKTSRRSHGAAENNGSSATGTSSIVRISENKTELQLPLKILNDRITCILCNGYFVDATTVLDCLHTFCKSCLLKHFDEHDNTCPKCQTLIHQSHPTHYVAFDRTLQDIVYKLVPGMQAEEKRRREEYEANHSPSDSDADMYSEDESPKASNSQNKDKEKEKEKDNGVEEEQEADPSICCLKDPCAGHRREDEPILVILDAHELLAPIPKPFIRLPGIATINTIKRYISLILRGNIKYYQEYDIFCNDELMGRDFSMAFIYKTRWRNQSSAPMRLSYRPHFDY